MVILAIAATVAIQSLQPQVDNRRFQTATGLLEKVEAAVGGPNQKFQADGTPLVSGFVADVGCFPGFGLSTGLAKLSDANLMPRTDAGSLDSLWRSDPDIGLRYPFEFRAGPSQPVDYSAVRLPCGWRGPYLNLPMGQTELIDPWGKPLEVLRDTGESEFSIRIQIPDNSSLGGRTLDLDLDSCKVEVIGNLILENPEKAKVQVALLTPDPNSSLTHLAVLDDEDTGNDTFRFSNVPIGVRAIVADVDGARFIKYIHVPRSGVSLVIDCQSR